MSAFNSLKYKNLQKNEILERISKFDKLYIEVGGKLVDDHHASRVLPGFESDIKMQIFKELKKELEVIFCVNAKDIISGKIRSDNGLNYGDETLRLAKFMQGEKIDVAGIMINFYEPKPEILNFEKKSKQLGFETFKSYFIDDYPNSTNLILSENGFGKNDYIKTQKKLILVSAPGANSGKLETCLSQIYNDKLHGITSCFAKYETFPVWNLPLNHLTNIAYEMSTIDISDRNMIDPFYKKAHGKEVVNYNRDIESFPILSKLFTQIMGKEIYDSPTSMGINCVGFAIENDFEVQRASFEEIERRHKKHIKMFKDKRLSLRGLIRSKKLLKKSQKIMKKLEKNEEEK